MKYNARKLKSSSPEKNTLYCLYPGDRVFFEELQEDKTTDKVIIHANLSKGQYMLYAEEYRAPFMNKKEYKKADILALAVDEQNLRYHSYLFDVKKDVGGDEVIFHLISQWADSLLHLDALLVYLPGYAGEQTIGVFTRKLDLERVKRSIADKKQELKQMENGPDTIARAKLGSLLFEKRQAVHVLEKFTEGYFEARGRNHPYVVYALKQQGSEFSCGLDIKLQDA